MISRSTLFTVPGGDTVQVVQTAEHLRRIGVEVDIRLANEKIDYSSYDLLHFFNIIRPADIMSHARRAKRPYVVSTIFVEYTEADRIAGHGLRKLLSRYVSPNFVEYMKAIARALANGEMINDWRYILLGHSRSIRKIISGSSLLLPNSASEYTRLSERHRISHKYVVVPNGIDQSVFFNRGELNRSNCICVGRIEYLKNQLNVIRAFKGLPYQLTIVGKAAPNHQDYFRRCQEEAPPNVHFVDHVTPEALSLLFAKSKVHVLASWFETTGLASLEAAACGCNIVTTKKGDQVEYFGENAYYCTPDNVESIRAAVERAYGAEVDPEFLRKISLKYTWEETAKVTLGAYQQVLNLHN